MLDLTLQDVAIGRGDGTVLLDHVDLVWPTSITALVGVNGAGKSTLLKAIAGLVPLVRGTVNLAGDDNHRDRRRFQRQIAYMPQNFTAYRDLTASEFMRYLLGLRGVERRLAGQATEQWLERVGLSGAARQRTGTFSQGMLQRLGFACTLQIACKLYLFDEPFAGVDPEARADLTDLLFTTAADRLVIVSTHHLDEMVNRGAGLVHIRDGTVTL